MKQIELRRANSKDEDFIRNLFCEVRRDQFEIAGLPEAQLETLLGMQFNAQNASYDSRFPNAEHFVIESGRKKVGRILIERSHDRIHLIDISILRTYRSKGIASYILDQLKLQTGLIILSVFALNHPAIRLYQKHGFTVTSNGATYLEMEWKNA